MLSWWTGQTVESKTHPWNSRRWVHTLQSLTSSYSRCGRTQWWGWAEWGWRQSLLTLQYSARLRGRQKNTLAPVTIALGKNRSRVSGALQHQHFCWWWMCCHGCVDSNIWILNSGSPKSSSLNSLKYNDDTQMSRTVSCSTMQERICRDEEGSRHHSEQTDELKEPKSGQKKEVKRE